MLILFVEVEKSTMKNLFFIDWKTVRIKYIKNITLFTYTNKLYSIN